MNDIVGVNTRAFELAASGAARSWISKASCGALHPRGGGRGLPRSRRAQNQLGYYLAHPDEARAIGGNAMKRALQEHTLRHRIERSSRRRAALRKEMTCCCVGTSMTSEFPDEARPEAWPSGPGYEPRRRELRHPGRTGLKTEAAPPSRPAIAFAALPRRLAQEKPKRS